jgi:hypothetical protein
MLTRWAAQLEHIFQDGTSFSYPVTGKLHQAVASDAIAWCEDVEEDTVLPNGVIVVEQSGTYCNDGKRVGDVGMSDSELLAACPI